MPPFINSQIYRGRLLTASAFQHMFTYEHIPDEWYTHLNEKYTILHVPGCNLTLPDMLSNSLRDCVVVGFSFEFNTGIQQCDTNQKEPTLPWDTVLEKLGPAFMDPLVNISSDSFVQLRKYIKYAANPDEKDGIYILQTQMNNIGDINSMKLKCNARVNIDFYMNYSPVYDLRRRSLDQDNRPHLVGR